MSVPPPAITFDVLVPSARFGDGHTNSRKFPPNMQNHDDGHDEGDNVHRAGSALEDNRIGQLDVARKAVGLDADATWSRCSRSYRRAQRQWRHVADVGEVPEACHGRVRVGNLIRRREVERVRGRIAPSVSCSLEADGDVTLDEKGMRGPGWKATTTTKRNDPIDLVY